jgi:hypothetical protein
MTREDLMQLAARLNQSPVPTLQKKVYGYQGHITPLLDALPLAITIDSVSQLSPTHPGREDSCIS